MLNVMQTVEQEMDKAVIGRGEKCWRIYWKGMPIVARSKGAWRTKAAARMAFHDTYGSTLSLGVLTSEGKCPYKDVQSGYGNHTYTKKVPIDIGVNDRNAIIFELEKLGLLEFKQG